MSKNKKKSRKINGYKILGFSLIVSTLLVLGVVLYIDVLPFKYIGLLAGVLLFIDIIVNYFLFRKNIKKKPRKVFTVIGILFTLIFLALSFFIYKTFGVIDDMSIKYKTYTYHVLVKNDSSYEKIEDISDNSLGYYNDNSESTKKALQVLKKKVTTNNESYGNLDSLGSSLLNGETESLLLEDSQKTKLDNSGNSSESAVSGFSNLTKVIYTFKVRVKLTEEKIDVTKDVFNIYISGMDEYGEVSEISRSDVNMIVTVNPKTKQILLTNIPRDYYVQLHDTTGYKDKLTHAGIYGIETSMTTLEDLFGIDINYYFKVNFSSLVNIIDSLGGVDVYSEYDFQSYNGYNFSKGYNSVDGKAGLSFVRERKTFAEGDNQRGKNQQAMMEAIFRKCTSPSIITKYNSLLNSLKDSMLTNMPTKSMTALAKMQLRTDSGWTITSNSLTGTGSYDYTYTYSYQELYVMVPNDDSVLKGKDLIAKVSEGKKLESSYDGDSSDVHSVTKSYVPKKSSSSFTTNSTTQTKKSTTTVKKQTTKKPNPVKEPVVKQPEVKEDNSESSNDTPEVEIPTVPDDNTNIDDAAGAGANDSNGEGTNQE